MSLRLTAVLLVAGAVSSGACSPEGDDGSTGTNTGTSTNTNTTTSGSQTFPCYQTDEPDSEVFQCEIGVSFCIHNVGPDGTQIDGACAPFPSGCASCSCLTDADIEAANETTSIGGACASGTACSESNGAVTATCNAAAAEAIDGFVGIWIPSESSVVRVGTTANTCSLSDFAISRDGDQLTIDPRTYSDGITSVGGTFVIDEDNKLTVDGFERGSFTDSRLAVTCSSGSIRAELTINIADDGTMSLADHYYLSGPTGSYGDREYTTLKIEKQ